ncbi:murein biosynthesis integral membrane protein MurJ [Streptomyces rimosus subsp. rimosus ATCC 10970]|uniref:Murein biosynthesis integral membrane protein MurJ n=3 Tax=Streptomyces TaxID=1883 RepID=L8EIA5_STRR1|nr:murein biosynthesis integral membrane protein MurJ [Streptomyces sp. SID5471]QDA04315.1 murein biosynthesis integral membrane protein MurJ [Streptomyces rimosus]QGY67465.1 murein biosynthesis integral membrane protein MurJ [Streptomyces rimosus R6-500]QST83658.1 murein biosynthesis integral membrane protein MurJ [Streptomyces rimosus subsp. rimosus ATCC 10970]QTL86408.1 murein biosynthesis integral membrane protein MurJ [Streptomyces rimosus subsp. rimosus]
MVEGTRTHTHRKNTADNTGDGGVNAALSDESGPPSGSLRRSSLLMAAGTVVSRATGLFRGVLQAAALGTGLLATTYNTANLVPMSLYTLLIGGALNAVLVPQLVRARAEHPDGGRAHEQRLVTLVLTVLGIGTLLAVWAAPGIVSLYTTDTPENHAAYELTVVFARFLLPQIFFYGVYGIFGQVLNARGKFGAMMWTPVLNNVVLIAMFGAYVGLLTIPETVAEITDAQVRLLGVGTTLGIALQALALIPYAREAGFRFRPRFDWRGTGLRKSANAARWTLLFVLVNLVSMTIVAHYATAADQELPKDGVGFSSYSYAQNIWGLPQSIVTVSLITALLPRMTRAVAEQRLDDLRGDLSRALRLSGAVIVPAAVFFVAFGPEMAQLLYAHGAASAESAVPLGQMLQALGLGLIPFSAQSLLLRGFYAFEDTRTPFLLAVCISGVNIALATACHLLLPARWAVTGMAAAYAVAYAVGLLASAFLLRRRLEGRLDGRRLSRTYGKLTGAALAAGAVGWAAAHACAGATGDAFWSTALALAAGAATMALLFLLLARVLRITELRSLPGLR